MATRRRPYPPVGAGHTPTSQPAPAVWRHPADPSPNSVRRVKTGTTRRRAPHSFGFSSPALWAYPPLPPRPLVRTNGRATTAPHRISTRCRCPFPYMVSLPPHTSPLQSGGLSLTSPPPPATGAPHGCRRSPKPTQRQWNPMHHRPRRLTVVDPLLVSFVQHDQTRRHPLTTPYSILLNGALYKITGTQILNYLFTYIYTCS
jgi:hypothetical protein